MLQKPAPKRGFALLATLLVLVVMASLASQLATVTATESLIADLLARDIAHDLAVDSAVNLVALKLRQPDPRFFRDLENDRFAVMEFPVGGYSVSVILQDDRGKFDVLGYHKPEQMSELLDKLQSIAQKKSLPVPNAPPRPIHPQEERDDGPAFVCLEQLLPRIPGSRIHRIWKGDLHKNGMDGSPRWSDYLTVFGDGTMDTSKMDDDLFEIIFGEARGASGESSSSTPVRSGVTNAGRSGRYALTIRTGIGADVRFWYVVVNFAKDQAPDIRFRGAIQW